MSIAYPFSELEALSRLPFPTQLSVVIGVIHEVHPATPSPNGSRQLLRVRGSANFPFDVQLFDQGDKIQMGRVGDFIRVSASPTGGKALVWEMSKAYGPKRNVGVIVVRKNARVELIRPAEAATVGVTTLGFMPAVPARSLPTPAAPAESQHPAPMAPLAPFAASSPARAPLPPAAQAAGQPAETELVRSFFACLAAARNARGPQDSEEDVRLAARAAFDCMHAARSAA